MAEQATIHKNMYMVNKETGLIHAYFKLDPKMRAPEGEQQNYLSGNVYIDGEHEISLNEIKQMNFSEDYDELDDVDPDRIAMHFVDRPWEYFCSVHYADYKGYRIIEFADSVQLSDDFSNNDFIEAQAFVAILFQRSVGAEAIAKWSSEPWDKYGVLARIEQDFFILGDDNEDIYNSRYLTDRPQLESPQKERWAEKIAKRDAEAKEWSKKLVAEGEQRISESQS